MEPQVFKIMTGPQWALWRGLGTTFGSPDDRRDGFIHFSAAHQVPGTLSKHFAAFDRLWLVEGIAERMGPDLKWEASRNGQMFPHLYGPFDVTMSGRDWPLARAGLGWTLPFEAAP